MSDLFDLAHKESKPAPTGTPPIVHPSTIRLDGFGEGMINRLWDSTNRETAVSSWGTRCEVCPLSSHHQVSIPCLKRRYKRITRRNR